MWVSPDGKIHKLVLVEGTWGTKPTELSECEITISEAPQELLVYSDSVLIIGDSDNHLTRSLDNCLLTMNEQETAKFKILSDNISFTIKLNSMRNNGLIHEWDAKRKFEIAVNHKEKGVALYNQNRGKDAAYRFAKALKIIHSIPIDVETVPDEIDGIPLTEIDRLKANLYNNLASFYLKKGAWVLTIETSRRVLDYDKDSIKAHYKLAVAYINDRNFERAQDALDVVLAGEPGNKAALEHMRRVKDELHKADMRVNTMVKKMFV